MKVQPYHSNRADSIALGAKKTIKRDWLKRQVEKGNVVLVGSYHFDDMMGESRSQNVEKPVAIDPGNWQDRKEGVVYIHASSFRSGSGRAWQEKNGVITLYVHSNSHYELRIKETK